MRRICTLLPLLIALLMPRFAWADKYQDPETKVNYIYTPGSGVAEVYNSDQEKASISGYIALLMKFTVDGEEYKVTSIRSQAFMSCKGLQGITIPMNIENIGNYAFTLCNNLTRVFIGRSVREIDDFAFSQSENITTIEVDVNNPYYNSHNNCNAIIETAKKRLLLGCKNTTIPEDVEIIGSGAFYYGTGPKNLNISKNVKQIHESSFCCVGGLETITVDAANSVYDSRNQCNAIIETATGKLMRGCSKTVIPADVKEIVSRAFMKCTQMESIIIPDGVVQIGASAFMDCSSLKNIEIPASVEKIEKYNPFSGCSGLQTIKVADGNSNYVSQGNCNAIIEKETGILISGCMGTVTIPSVVKEIGNYAFENISQLTSVEIPANVEKFGDSSFRGCNGLTIVTSHIKNPTYISNQCFMVKVREPNTYAWTNAILRVPRGCTESYKAKGGWNKFKTIEEFDEPEIPAYNDGEMFTVDAGNGIELRYTVISAEEKSCMLGIKDKLDGEYYPTAFADGSAGKGTGMAYKNVALAIPSEVNGYKVIEIAPEALEASYITGITIPSTVTKIGDAAFYSTRIRELVIPASVTEIGLTAIASNKLQKIEVDAANPVYDSRENCNAVIVTTTNTLVLGFEGTTIVEGIETIGKYAFPWFRPDGGPKEIRIPKTVTRIVDNPFYYNQNTERIIVSADNSVYDSREDCNAIINTATGELITGCKNTIIPDGVTRIGKQAFAALNNKMESISLPASVLSIGEKAFYKTNVNVVLPSNLQKIEDYAFQQNEALKEITFPATVTSIGKDAFFHCTSLEKVTSLIEEPMPLDHAFCVWSYGDWTEAVLYVPAGTKALYEATDGWNKFKTVVEMNPYDVLDNNTVAAHFLQPDEEGKMEIPATVEIDGKMYTVTEIAANAFKDNKKLTEVMIPGTVTKIGDGAFAGCENLRNIYVYAQEPISLTAAKARSMMTRAAENVPSQFEGIDFEACTLYVPIGSEQKYREAEGWKLFTHIVGVVDPSGITNVQAEHKANEAVYNLSGQRLVSPHRGLNIIGGKKVVVQ